MDRQVGSIDDPISLASEFGYTLFFESDPIQNGKMWQQWVGAPGFRKSSDQYLFTSFKKKQLNRMAERLHPFQDTDEIRKERTLPNVDPKSNVGNFALLLVAEINKGREQSGGKIVDAEISGILKCLEGVGFTRA